MGKRGGAEFADPVGKFFFEFPQHIQPRLKLHDMPLAVVKRDGFNPLIF